MKKRYKLVSQTLPICDLKNKDTKAMFEVFSKYYSNTSYDQFMTDLEEKDVVFLLMDAGTKDIKGFSTLVNLYVNVEGQEQRGCFSGDTILEKEYWGQGTLGIAFLRYLFIQKIKNPFKPLYWFLISKGYKTYLLMANNFKTHYPRHENLTPEKQKSIIAAFSKTLYGDYFNDESGVISFSKVSSKDCLKAEITPITKDLLLKNDRIKFFADKNPNWEEGNELACVAEMTLGMPFYYQMKVMKKQWRRMIKGFSAKPVTQKEKA